MTSCWSRYGLRGQGRVRCRICARVGAEDQVGSANGKKSDWREGERRPGESATTTNRQPLARASRHTHSPKAHPLALATHQLTLAGNKVDCATTRRAIGME